MSPPFHTANVQFAYQLHYHVGFRTKCNVPVFNTEPRQSALRQFLTQVCKKGGYRALETEIDSSWVRLLLSFQPAHSPAKGVQAIKGNASRLFFETFPEAEQQIGRRSLWSRAYYLRSVGDATNETVRAYIASQREHHANDASQLLADYKRPNPQPFFELRPFAHCMAEYNCHFVCCPVRHVPAIDEKFGQGLVDYMLSISAAREFEVISLAVLSDHIHLLAALKPEQSPEFLALAVMNNTSHWFRQRNPGVFKVWDVPGFWSSSAFVRTAGVVTSGHVRHYLKR